uniref:Uncharacterized protein n=1 Tax=Kalanchoe fedtschenkoi TaxID=63787 RepID=A0A7N0T5H3_KALFE
MMPFNTRTTGQRKDKGVMTKASLNLSARRSHSLYQNRPEFWFGTSATSSYTHTTFCGQLPVSL